MKKKIYAIFLVVLFSGCLSNTSTWDRVDADTFNQEIKENKSAFILDVRTLSEWNDDGYIDNATLIPHDELEKNEENLPEDKDDLILLYCRSGNRSENAAQTLIDMGYKNIIELKTGINGWKSGGYSVIYP
jgi:rhodanese-related sulfurtransferase